MSQRSSRRKRSSLPVEIGVSAGLETHNDGMTTKLETRDSSVTFEYQLNEGATASSATPKTASGAIVLSHEIQLDSFVSFFTVCSDTSEFRSDRSGCVVAANSAGDGSAALPQPCLVARVGVNKHLTVLSVDGSVRLRIHCDDIKWNDFYGLHGDRQLLFVLQRSALTVTDLSGHKIRQILAETAGFTNFIGICGNAASVLLSDNKKIAAFSKSTGQLETIITLQQIPDVDLRRMVCHADCILVADSKHYHVHRVRTATQQVVATYPTQQTGLTRFELPFGLAVDSRGRMFVSENFGHSVRAVAADGSLLWTLGVPGEAGSDGGRLNYPWGLAVVTGGVSEQLVVADYFNNRLLVFKI